MLSSVIACGSPCTDPKCIRGGGMDMYMDMHMIVCACAFVHACVPQKHIVHMHVHADACLEEAGHNLKHVTHVIPKI